VRADHGPRGGRGGECGAAKRRSGGIGLARPQVWSGSVLSAAAVGQPGCIAAGGKGGRATSCASGSGAQGLQPGAAALRVTARACRMCFCSACA
jgi:hypothetical protein